MHGINDIITEHARKLLHPDSLSRFAPKSLCVNFEINNSINVNAHVRKINNHHLISINNGLILELNRKVHQNAREILDSSCGKYCRMAADAAFHFGIIFVLGHELAHILLQHLNFSVDKNFNYCLEAESDKVGVEIAFAHLSLAWDQRTIHDDLSANDADVIRCFCHGIYSTMRVLYESGASEKYPNIYDQPNSQDYPSSYTRFLLLIAHMAHAAEKLQKSGTTMPAINTAELMAISGKLACSVMEISEERFISDFFSIDTYASKVSNTLDRILPPITDRWHK